MGPGREETDHSEPDPSSGFRVRKSYKVSINQRGELAE